MGCTRIYALKMNLAKAIPLNALSSTEYCLADPGNEYLVYNPGKSKTFSIALLSGTYDFEWFNPTSGKIVDSGSFQTSDGSRSFQTPFNGDAVLYIKRTRASAWHTESTENQSCNIRVSGN